MVTDPMVSIFDNKFDSLNTSCGKVSDKISFSKSSDKNFIQIINTSTMRAEQMIMIPEYGYGITLIDNDIVLGNIGEIYIINREGERLNTIKVGKGTMYSLYCGKDKTLYCCDADNDTLYGIKQDGTILFSFSSGYFKAPICVAAAANGNLYVAAWETDNVHCFTPDGKHKGH
jgi:outer membrane protein assembly factor BamB